MGTRTVTTWTSDLSGKTIDDSDPTLRFAIDGIEYEIDLTAAERAKLDKALAPYIEAATKLSTRGKRITRTVTAANATTVRAWARSQGIDVPMKGQIPKSVREAFDDAH